MIKDIDYTIYKYENLHRCIRKKLLRADFPWLAGSGFI